jgi:hypothetical protein
MYVVIAQVLLLGWRRLAGDSGPSSEPICHPVPPQKAVCWHPQGVCMSLLASTVWSCTCVFRTCVCVYVCMCKCVGVSTRCACMHVCVRVWHYVCKCECVCLCNPIRACHRKCLPLCRLYICKPVLRYERLKLAAQKVRRTLSRQERGTTCDAHCIFLPTAIHLIQHLIPSANPACCNLSHTTCSNHCKPCLNAIHLTRYVITTANPA